VVLNEETTKNVGLNTLENALDQEKVVLGNLLELLEEYPPEEKKLLRIDIFNRTVEAYVGEEGDFGDGVRISAGLGDMFNEGLTGNGPYASALEENEMENAPENAVWVIHGTVD
jgi:hypothetical protein